MKLAGAEVGVAGYYTFLLNGEPVFECPSKNLITDFGWNRLSNLTTAPTAGLVIQVGTGNTTPAYTDTALAAFLASTTASSETPGTGSDVNGNYSYSRFTFSFALGAVVGNVAEVGFKVATGDASITSRSLVKDGAGNPAIIVVTATDTLTVLYELRYYRASLDITSTVMVGATSTTYVLRTGTAVAGTSGNANDLGGFKVGGINLNHIGTGGSLGAVDTDPSGTQVAALTNVAITSTVTVGTGTTTVTFTTPTIGTGAGNSSGGVVVAAIGIRQAAGPSGLGAYGNMKASFSPAIPKSTSSTLSYSFSFTFTRM